MKRNINRFVAMKATAVETKVGLRKPSGRIISEPPDYQAVVGLDVGDRQTHYCVLDLDGDLAVEGAVATREASLRVQFEGKARMRIALEAGTHSGWINRLLVELGHEVIVANPRKVRLISGSDSKNDPADARTLARLAHVGPELLWPIQPRSEKTQVDLALVRARDVAVQSRTKIVNAVRGIVKSTGFRLPKSSTLTFARKAKDACPEALRPALLPLLRVIEELTREIELTTPRCVFSDYPSARDQLGVFAGCRLSETRLKYFSAHERCAYSSRTRNHWSPSLIGSRQAAQIFPGIPSSVVLV